MKKALALISILFLSEWAISNKQEFTMKTDLLMVIVCLISSCILFVLGGLVGNRTIWLVITPLFALVLGLLSGIGLTSIKIGMMASLASTAGTPVYYLIVHIFKEKSSEVYETDQVSYFRKEVTTECDEKG